MKEENYEVVVFQGDPGTIDLTYEEIEADHRKDVSGPGRLYQLVHAARRPHCRF